jgi:hypothetical protein
MVWQSFRDYDQGTEHFQLFSTYYNGSTWSSVNRIGPQAGYHDLQPAVAAGRGDTVWCAYQSWRNGQADVWVSSEVHGGAWSTPVRLTTDSLEQLYPCITADHAGRPWVFWITQANGRWSIQGRTNQGGWQPAFLLDSTGDDGPPRAAVDVLGDIWVVWQSRQGTQSHIYCARRSDSTWTAPEPVTSGSTDDYLPDICSGPDTTVWACWQSDSGPGTPSNICWALNDAHMWTVPYWMTSDNAHAYDATITSDTSGNIWFAWASDRRGYWNIYASEIPYQPTAVNGPQPAARSPQFAVSSNPFARAVSFLGPERFSVEVFSISGRKLAHIDARAGKAIWVPDKLPCGVYLARLAAPENQSVVKLLYTK